MVFRPQTKAKLAKKSKRCPKCGKIVRAAVRCKRCHKVQVWGDNGFLMDCGPLPALFAS